MRMMMIMTMNMLRMGRAQLSIKADIVCGDSKAWPREIKRDARRVDLHKMRKHRNVTLVNMSHSQLLGKFEYGLPAKF